MTQVVAKTLIALTLVAAACSFDLRADEPTVISGLNMGANLEALADALGKNCHTVTEISKDRISYPLAAKSELHLVCDGYHGEPIEFDRAAFVIADGLLVQAETRGVNLASARQALGEPDGVYLGMNNYRQGTLWLDTGNRKLFWLAEDARHPNLFAWSNPALGDRTATGENTSTQIPDLLDFSASLEDLLPRFEAQCRQLVIHENERIWLPHEPEKQVQIDCFGFPFAGFERKVEAVFGDGKLEVIWVLTGKPEESRLSAMLHQDWGQPNLANDSWEVFGEGRISLYKDKPEFLILSDDMIPLYREEFEGK